MPLVVVEEFVPMGEETSSRDSYVQRWVSSPRRCEARGEACRDCTSAARMGMAVNANIVKIA